jgi:hypothetical protein
VWLDVFSAPDRYLSLAIPTCLSDAAWSAGAATPGFVPMFRLSDLTRLEAVSKIADPLPGSITGAPVQESPPRFQLFPYEARIRAATYR